MKTFTYLSLVGLMTCLAGSAFAQQNPGGGMGDRLFPMVAHVLTADQRQSLMQMVASQRAEMKPLEEKLRTSRGAMLDEIASGNFDENLVRQYAEESARAEADLMVILARDLSRVQPPLSASQVAQMKNSGGGHLQEARHAAGTDQDPTAPEVHMNLPPALPRDTNDLPVVN